jgi:hypothetical protein
LVRKPVSTAKWIVSVSRALSFSLHIRVAHSLKP